MRVAYLFSRYPIVSQTFCDTEMLALERLGVELEIYSIYPPPTAFRHGHAGRLRAPIHYAPPGGILKLGEQAAKAAGRWPATLIAEHDRRYGLDYKAALRARNALYFADLFKARGITHFHVHFANRAAHTGVFVKALSGIPFSMSTHGQDFMSDLGSPDLLREITHEAVFVANETEWSKGVVSRLCPDSTGKMFRVFNGMDLENFPATEPPGNPVPRILSIGRLIEFKGFHHLIAACALLHQRGVAFECDIMGEGPWREQLELQIAAAGLTGQVRLPGALPQEEIFAELRRADIFALACCFDAQGASDVFPTVILEAMATGRPVVSTLLAGVPEQVEPESTGLLVEPGDEAGLAAALERLLTDPALRRALGEAGRARVKAEFAVERTIRPLLGLFERYIPGSGEAPSREAGVACLQAEWPGCATVEAELAALREHRPSLCTWVLHPGSAAGSAKTLPAVDFLPDGMVIEAEWQQERALARRMETWRNELGTKLPSETFLLQGRNALYLRTWVARQQVRHVHAPSTSELLLAWLLARLCGITFSLTVEERTLALPATVAARLSRDATAARYAPEQTAWSATIEAGPRLHVIRGRLIDPQWVQEVTTPSKS